MIDELKNPLLYKNIIMPIIGPIPKTKSTNFAEFFVWPNFWSFKFELVCFFFDFFFFMLIYYYNSTLKDFDMLLGLKNFLNWRNLYGSQKDLIVVAPGFSVDCLETLEEIEIQGKEEFFEKGGTSFSYIKCLNDSEISINMYSKIINRELSGWI